MRQVIILGLIILSASCKGQSINPHIETKDYANYANYKGKVFKINDNILLRTKIYGRKYVQNTFIFKKNKFEVRMYCYYNLFTFALTPAISLRRSI